MQSTAGIFRNLLNTLLPNRAAPMLGRVIKSYEGAGKNKYSCDVRVLTAGTLEDTTQVISEVPISPIWVGRSKRGVYAIPPKDAVVIVGFIGWNPAYPYIAGIYSDEYEAANFAKDKFIITDGDGTSITIDGADKSIALKQDKITLKLKGNKISIKNASKNLFTILDTHLQNYGNMQTNGSTTTQVLSPGDKVKTEQTRNDLADVMEA